jgi:RecB family exonuclease
MKNLGLHFLGWEKAPLERAAEWLHDEYGPGTERNSNLSEVVVVLPGARSGRILREALAQKMPGNWQPPEIVTTGRLTDKFLRLDAPPAPQLVRTLAWEQALRGLARSDIRALLAEQPKQNDKKAWSDLAAEVREVFSQLAAECTDFCRVSAEAMGTKGLGEQRRWRTLGLAQEATEGILKGVSMCDPHLGRLQALERNDFVKPERQVVLVGVVDANGLVRQLLGSLENANALVFAPESRRDAFDEMGCLLPKVWLKSEWSVPLDNWQIAIGPDDQARKALVAIARWKGAYSAEEITIGLGDSEVAPFIERRFNDHQVSVRDAKGIEFGSTPPARLLKGALAFLRRMNFAGLAALVRHPDLEDYLTTLLAVDAPELDEYTCAQILDGYHGDHLPGAVPQPWLEALADRDSNRNELARQLGEAVQEWLSPMAGKPQLLSNWADQIRDVLNAIYGKKDFDKARPEDHLTRSALLGLAKVLTELAEIPQEADFLHDGGDALELVLSAAADGHIQASEPEEGAPTVEMLGWLELAFDDAPALVVTGFNETFIPKSVVSDRYLPNSLRTELGLPDDQDRLGRDLFTLEWLINSRKQVLLLTGRHNMNGDPLRPSRLAFQGSDQEILERIRWFLKEDTQVASEPSPALADRVLPLPDELSEPNWSASAIGAYLQSPYMFAINYMTGFRTLDDRDPEMNPMVFGNLGHNVLCKFAKSSLALSTDADAITSWLEETLEKERKLRFGDAPLPAVQLQCRQLAWRLGLFARAQAARTEEGWRIKHAEWKPTRRVTLNVNGEEVPLRGQIDRLDQHKDGRWCILDYKFSDTAKTPEKAHHRSGNWQSVQLPIYAHLARELVGSTVPELGYFNLSSTDAKIDIAAKWGATIVEEALAESCRVVLAVREQLSRHPREFPLGGSKIYDPVMANVCGKTLLSLPGEGDE